MDVKNKNIEDIASGLFDIARQIKLLGNGDASTGPVPFGAIEGLAMKHCECTSELGDKIYDGLSSVADSLSEVASALNRIADSLPSKNA